MTQLITLLKHVVHDPKLQQYMQTHKQDHEMHIVQTHKIKKSYTLETNYETRSLFIQMFKLESKVFFLFDYFKWLQK